MLNLTQLTERAVRFLKKYGHLDEPGKAPDFRAEDQAGFMTPLAQSYPWYRADPNHFQPELLGEEVYENDYNHIELPDMFNKDFEKTPLKDIPDSEDCMLIDIGSGMGRRLTRPLARAKPNLQVVMVDKYGRAELEKAELYKVFPRNDIAGEEFKVKVPITDDAQATFNKLLQVNGYHNVRYVHSKLSLDSYTLPIDTQGKRVFMMGMRNPIGLGNITAQLAIELEAEKVYFNNSALEMIKPDSRAYGLMRNFLSSHMSEAETSKVIDLIYDPDSSVADLMNQKYDTQKPSERYFANTLKLLFALAQKDHLEKNGFQARIFENLYMNGPGFYNCPSHNIIATRTNTN